jgi:excisionase family DNA binding protein
MDRRYLSTRDAAAYLGMSVDALHRLTSNQDIPHIKVHAHRLAFDRLDLDAWMRARRVEPAR